MNEIKIPETLPICDLISILADKANQRHDIHFDFFGKLNDFRERISQEVRFINVLFPEYTPHDEEYHLKRIFHVADTVLGRQGIDQMNSAELFVLAVSLYGHDWGMAVSESEKDYIITGKLPDGMDKNDFCILHNEREQFLNFIKNHGFSNIDKVTADDIPIGHWRNYIRKTHAFRSGERIKRYFEKIDNSVAEAASRICIGHALEIEDIDNYKSYPPDFSVLRETVNLRALTIYVRLIDLLDLSDDRTPYIIWKFVAPRNPFSKMEWSKHRALQPLTASLYQNGRIILIDGSTNDHEVYASLQDLNSYCDDQFRHCNDLLARMNDPRHKLDIYHIEWRISAQGFKPISIQFEFDRDRMFEILSDEIYQGDPYVFLRELLQNSIDAIRMRREVLRNAGLEPKEFGAISVNVAHKENGDAIVTWHDDGIGMDEYIVRNYLSIAGKSYYQSTDFLKQGLKIDPISRFGIGILSCFMVAERVEIETLREPNCHPSGEPLRIIIPSIKKQFRIEILPHGSIKTGTTIKVFVEGRMLPKENNGYNIKPLEVTSYLSAIAGFVESPIVITEGECKTIILHPDQDSEVALKRFGQDFNVHKINFDYPWKEVFLAQDLKIAQELFKDKYLHISNDLQLTGYEGCVTFIAPIVDEADIVSGHRGVGTLVRGVKKDKSKSARFELHQTKKAVGLSLSSKLSPYQRIFRDGILIPDTSTDLLATHHHNRLPISKLTVNIPKLTSQKIDLARTQLKGGQNKWDIPIKKAIINYISRHFSNDLLSSKPAERFYKIGQLLFNNNLPNDCISEFLPIEKYPLPFVSAKGDIIFKELQDIMQDDIHINIYFSWEMCRIIEGFFLGAKKHLFNIDKWKGADFLALTPDFLTDRSESPIEAAYNFCTSALNKTHFPSQVRFLHPSWKGNPPLSHIVWIPKPKANYPDPESILEKAIKNLSILSPFEKYSLLVSSNSDNIFLSDTNVMEFSSPFDYYFAYGSILFNLKHPVTQLIIKCMAFLKLPRARNLLSDAAIGFLHDNIRQCIPMPYDRLNFASMQHGLQQVCMICTKYNLFEIYNEKDLTLSPEDFIPGTIRCKNKTWSFIDIDLLETSKAKNGNELKSFGKPLKKHVCL